MEAVGIKPAFPNRGYLKAGYASDTSWHNNNNKNNDDNDDDENNDDNDDDDAWMKQFGPTPLLLFCAIQPAKHRHIDLASIDLLLAVRKIPQNSAKFAFSEIWLIKAWFWGTKKVNKVPKCT